MSLINEYRKMRAILESAERPDMTLEKLPYKKDELDPVLSSQSLDIHYGKLAKTYVERWNANEGDPDFNYGGARLHNIYFPQFRAPKSGNKPTGRSAEIIDAKYGGFVEFQQAVAQEAMGIQGSGWLYMDPKGELHVIKNHQYRDSMKIVLLIDWWEHAWFVDYQSDKKKYLQNIWRIINWDVINQRLV